MVEEVMSLIQKSWESDLIVISSSIRETILKRNREVDVRELNAMVRRGEMRSLVQEKSTGKAGETLYRFDREAQRLEKAVERQRELDFEPGTAPVFA